MSPVLLFFLVMVICFAVALYFLRPGQTESVVRRNLAKVERNRSDRPVANTIVREDRLSSTPLLNEFLAQVPGTWELLQVTKQAGVRWQVSTILLVSLLVLFFSGLLLSVWSSNAVLVLTVAIAFGLLPIQYLYFLRHRRYRACEDLLPEAVDLMARAMRAGHALTSALEMVAGETAEPLGGEFRIVRDEQALGLPLREAMLGLVDRVPSNDVKFLATALLLQKETGGNLAQILDKTAAVMRDRVRMRGQVKIYTAQARATGWVICAMPFLLFILLSVANRSYERVLYTDPIGIKMLYAGLVMMVIGVLVVRKIVNIRI